MQVSAWADWLERADSLSGLCCFPHWPLLRCCYFAVQCRPARVFICAYLAGLVNPATPGLEEKACDRWFWQILVLVTYLAVENGGEAAKRKGKFPCFDFTPRVRKFSLEGGEIMLSWDQQSRRTRPWPLGRRRWKKEGCCSLRGWRSGAERGGNSPLARPQSNVKRHFLEIHSISAEIQKLLEAPGLKKKKKELEKQPAFCLKMQWVGRTSSQLLLLFSFHFVLSFAYLKEKEKKKVNLLKADFEFEPHQPFSELALGEMIQAGLPQNHGPARGIQIHSLQFLESGCLFGSGCLLDLDACSLSGFMSLWWQQTVVILNWLWLWHCARLLPLTTAMLNATVCVNCRVENMFTARLCLF